MLNYFDTKLEKGYFKGEFMKRALVGFMMVMFLCSVSFWSCSKDKDTGSKKGAIEKMTEKTGKEIADTLQKPIRNARSVKKKQEERDKELENAIKGQ
jgi:protein involved in sex pheromone biosynthesis